MNRKIIVNLSCFTFLMVIGFMIVFLNISCSGTNEEVAKKIKSTQIISSDSLGDPSDIIVFKDLIIILDKKPMNSDKQLRVYSSSNYEYLYSIGRIGSGPGEFRRGQSFNLLNENEGFSLMDLAANNFLTFSIASNQKVYNSHSVSLKEGLPYMPAKINDSTIVSLCYQLLRGRIGVYDTLGNLKKTIGELPESKYDNIPLPVQHQACKGRLSRSPDGSRLVISYQMADLLDIYDKRGGLIKRVVGESGFTPEYKVIQRGKPIMMPDREKGRYGYLDIDIVDEYIISIFSGESLKTGEYEGSKVFVFNLDGEFVKSKLFDKKVSKISIDKKNDKLYAIAYYPKPTIYSFNLNEILYY